MTKQAFIDFCAKAVESDDIAKQIEAAQTAADIVALGAQSGFVFSEADAEEGWQELTEQSDRELSEGELTAVSGGLFFRLPKLPPLWPGFPRPKIPIPGPGPRPFF